jgi:hypothetical protein
MGNPWSECCKEEKLDEPDKDCYTIRVYSARLGHVLTDEERHKKYGRVGYTLKWEMDYSSFNEDIKEWYDYTFTRINICNEHKL